MTSDGGRSIHAAAAGEALAHSVQELFLGPGTQAAPGRLLQDRLAIQAFKHKLMEVMCLREDRRQLT